VNSCYGTRILSRERRRQHQTVNTIAADLMSPNPRLYARQRRGSRNRSDPRGLLGLLLFAGVPSCSYGGRLGAAECSRLAPYFLSTDQRIALCRQATTGAPADCARKAHAAPKLSGSHVLDLCSGETSDFPGLCAAGLSRSIAKNLSPDLRIELCKGARSDVRCRKRRLHFAFVKRCGLQLDAVV